MGKFRGDLDGTLRREFYLGEGDDDVPGEPSVGLRATEDGEFEVKRSGGEWTPSGQEVHYHVRNDTGVQIDNGKAVAYGGTIGNSGKLKGILAIADGTQPAIFALGIATQDIDDGDDGAVTKFGIVRGINTSGSLYSETWADSDILYVHPTIAGGLTNVAPQPPNPAIPIAVVVSAHGTIGILFVRPTYPQKLTELADVNGAALTRTGQIPVWDSSRDVFDFIRNIDDYKYYCGFENTTDSKFSVSAGGVFTLEPSTLGGTFKVWAGGKLWEYNAALPTIEITEDQALTYLFVDVDGVLKKDTSVWDIRGDAAPCAIVFKDGSVYVVTEERHAYDRDRIWHWWTHRVVGASYKSGLTGTFTNTTFSFTQGVIADEDLAGDTLATQTNGSHWYRSTTPGKMRVIRNQTTPYAVNAGVIRYDNDGVLTNVPNNSYVSNWFYGTLDTDNPIYMVVGQAVSNNISGARNHALPEVLLSTSEWKLLYKVICQNAAGTPTFVESADFRKVQTGVPADGGSTAISHAALVDRDLAGSHPATAISYGATTVDAELALKSPLANPTFTGVPAAPTATQGTNTTQIATTAFVNAEIAADAAPIGHVGATGNAHGDASTSVSGFMSGSDKSKLDGIAANATNTPLTATAPVNVTKAAAVVGTSTDAARSDHKHDIATATPSSIGTANSEGNATSLARSNHVHSHGDQTSGTLHAAATASVNGFMSASDKTKLDGVVVGPASSVDAAIVLFDGITGKLVKVANVTIDDSGNVYQNANGSTPAAPRILGCVNFSSGEAARWEFGDSSNAIQNSWGGSMTIGSFHTLILRGDRNTVGPFDFETVSNIGVWIPNTVASSPACVVDGAVGQTADLHQWRNSSGTVLASVDASGNIVFNGTQTVDGVDVSGHAARHNAGGADALAIDAAAGTGSLRTIGTGALAACAGNDSRLSNARTPTSHASTHQSGGADSIKLDDLATPDDNTDLNATTTSHGLLMKLGGGTTNFLRADGTWVAPPGGGGGAPVLQTFTIALISADLDVQPNTATWGGLVIPAVNCSIASLVCWVTQAATGNVQGAIYNADTNARLDVTATVSAGTTGLKILTFSTAVDLTAGSLYYFAIGCDANGSRFAGTTAAGSTFNGSPKPSFTQLNNRLPATLSPSQSSSLVWIGALQ